MLGYLAELVEREAEAIYRNIEITGTYDFIFAKAKYAAAIGGRAVEICEDGYTVIREAKHPKLLQAMVPLDVEIGRSYRTLIITGPNTGGKTVVLKTFGLLALMVQSGLLVPVAPGSRFAVYRGIMAVIGDGQNLEQSLSTFSAQISALVTMLREAGPSTLLLIDELAAGTDPGEGIALSIAILEEFARKGATVLVTTHFNEPEDVCLPGARLPERAHGIRRRDAASAVPVDDRPGRPQLRAGDREPAGDRPGHRGAVAAYRQPPGSRRDRRLGAMGRHFAGACAATGAGAGAWDGARLGDVVDADAGAGTCAGPGAEAGTPRVTTGAAAAYAG